MSDQDADVSLEHERTAWDAIESRFASAAGRGRFLDLSRDDDRATTLTAADAAAAYAQGAGKIPPPTPRPSSRRWRTSSPPPPPLPPRRRLSPPAALERAIRTRRRAARDPRAARRDSERGEAEEVGPREIKALNRATAALSRQLEAWEPEDARAWDRAVEQIEKLNLLVLKANHLIGGLNRAAQQEAKAPAPRRRAPAPELAQPGKRARRGAAPVASGGGGWGAQRKCARFCSSRRFGHAAGRDRR